MYHTLLQLKACTSSYHNSSYGDPTEVSVNSIRFPMVIVDMGTEMYDASDFNMRMYHASLAFNPFHSGYLQTGGILWQTVKTQMKCNIFIRIWTVC